MNALLVAFLSLPTGPAPAPNKVEATLQKVAPARPADGRSAGQEYAVVLIHGLGVHPIHKTRVTRADLRTWQKADSPLVKELARQADVYAFAYAQNAAVDRIPELSGLVGHVRALHRKGYRHIVLVGHSAGGLVARHLVEDAPDAGVTKVIQVCAPNTGSSLAGVKAVREIQRAFLFSLTHDARKALLAKRQDRRIPDAVQFTCVVGTTALGGDGVVSRASQWSEDLQKQRIPAHLLRAAHWQAVRAAPAVELIGRLVREPQPRWKPEQVSEARKKLGLGTPADK